MKKGLLVIPALLLGLSLPVSVGSSSDSYHAAAAEIKSSIIIDDGKVVNGRTLVPIRVISEAWGVKVKWNQKLKTVTLIDGNNTFVFKANSKDIVMNGRTLTIDVPVKIYSGVTYVPLLVAVSQDAKVKWNNKTKAVTLTYGDKQVIVNTR